MIGVAFCWGCSSLSIFYLLLCDHETQIDAPGTSITCHPTDFFFFFLVLVNLFRETRRNLLSININCKTFFLIFGNYMRHLSPCPFLWALPKIISTHQREVFNFPKIYVLECKRARMWNTSQDFPGSFPSRPAFCWPCQHQFPLSPSAKFIQLS